jgi:hypothetical protein
MRARDPTEAASSRLLAAVGLYAASAGCAGAIDAHTRVPNPAALRAAGGEAEVTYDITVWIKDLKQPEGLAWVRSPGAARPMRDAPAMMAGAIMPRRFPQAAQLVFVDPDELRFELLLTAEWSELVHLGDYEIQLSDERGPLARPTDRWERDRGHRDYEAGYQAWKNFQTVRVHNPGEPTRQFDMWAPEQYYVGERVYRGGGTLRFQRADLLREDTRFLTLELRSRLRRFRFTWQFEPLGMAVGGRARRATGEPCRAPPCG